MTEKKYDKKAETKKDEAKAKKQPAKDQGELSDEQLDKAAGGAVDAFIWFQDPGVGKPSAEEK
jgi:hypothetical protein